MASSAALSLKKKNVAKKQSIPGWKAYRTDGFKTKAIDHPIKNIILADLKFSYMSINF